MKLSLLALLPLALLPLGAAACSTTPSAGSSPSSVDAAADSAASSDDDDASTGPTFGGARPVTLRIPAGYNPAKPAPLVMMLHGYGSASILTELYFKMSSIADEHGFFYIAPNGTFDQRDSRFWNATDACCDLFDAGVDDDGYLMSLIHDVRAAYNIDPARIYVMGHSNGGFMSHRLACNHADVFAAMVSYAGAVWSDPAKCNPTEAVGVLQFHGLADDTILYAGTIPESDAGDGGDAGAPPPGVYPGAKQTSAIWAEKNGCGEALVDTGMPIHVDEDFTGPESAVAEHNGCMKNGAAELWSVPDAGHVFGVAPEALESIWQFFEAHAKQ